MSKPSKDKPQTRTLAYKFRLRPRQGQAKRLGQYCGAARYAWNFALAEYETALDHVRAQGDEAEGATKSVRDVLEARMDERGLKVSRRGSLDRTLSLQSILYKLWCHHRDTEAPGWVQAATKGSLGGHSHVGSYPVQRVCDAINRWWKAKGKRAPWNTASERKAGKRTRAARSRASSGRLVGPPRYKRRGQNPAFTIQVKLSVVDRCAIRIPSFGRVYVADRADQDPQKIIPEGAVPKLLTIREVAGHWEASVCVTEPWLVPDREPSLPACGIDLGINAVATIAWSDGRMERVEPPRPLQRLGIRLVLLQRRLSLSKHVLRCTGCGAETLLGERRGRPRTCEGCGSRLRRWRSNRGERLKKRIARLHEHIARVRADHLHRLSHRLVREASVICTEPHHITGLVSAGVERRCEELKCKGIVRRAVRRAMLDIGWGQLRQQLDYKSKWLGCDYLTLPEKTASDKTCWSCGYKNEVPLDTSHYVCDNCGWDGTRQENTARLCLGYVQKIPGGDSGRPGGDPVTGREDGPSGRSRASSSRASARRNPGVNEGMGDTTPGGQKPPGGSRKRRKARKTEGSSRRRARA